MPGYQYGSASALIMGGTSFSAPTTPADGALIARSGTNLVGVTTISAALLETGGQALSLGAIPDGSVVKRSGTNLVGSIAALALGTTITAGLTAENTTAAANGAQQFGPGLVSIGQGWKANATAESQACGVMMYAQPVQGAAAPTVNARFATKVGAGAWTDRAYITSAGSFGCTDISTGPILCTTCYGNTAVGTYGDRGSGVTSYTILTNVAASPDGGSPSATLAKTPTGIAAANAGWFKLYVGTAVGWVPYWTA